MMYISIFISTAILTAVILTLAVHFLKNIARLIRSVKNGDKWEYAAGLLAVQIVGTIIGMFIFEILILLE